MVLLADSEGPDQTASGTSLSLYAQDMFWHGVAQLWEYVKLVLRLKVANFMANGVNFQ